MVHRCATRMSLTTAEKLTSTPVQKRCSIKRPIDLHSHALTSGCIDNLPKGWKYF